MSLKLTNTSPHAGHRARLRARFFRAPHDMAEYEVLELLIGYVLTRQDTKPLAKELLHRFENIRGVLSARPNELESVPGFGEGLSIFWKLLRECMARYEEAPVRQRHSLTTPEAVARMARARLTGCAHEECWVALVDSRNRCIAWERLMRGGVGAVPITPRDVLELALHHKASGIILVHNHPGGSTTPSGADRHITQELQHLATGMGMRFLDHIIVTESQCHSLVHHKLV